MKEASDETKEKHTASGKITQHILRLILAIPIYIIRIKLSSYTRRIHLMLHGGDESMTDEERDELLVRMDTKLVTLEKIVTKIEKAVFGNGEIGLITKVAKLEDKHTNNLQWIHILGWLVATGIAAIDIIYPLFFKQ